MGWDSHIKLAEDLQASMQNSLAPCLFAWNEYTQAVQSEHVAPNGEPWYGRSTSSLRSSDGVNYNLVKDSY